MVIGDYGFLMAIMGGYWRLWVSIGDYGFPLALMVF